MSDPNVRKDWGRLRAAPFFWYNAFKMGDRLTGRTTGSGPVNRGSNPCLPVLGSSMAEHPAVNRRVVGSSPTRAV